MQQSLFTDQDPHADLGDFDHIIGSVKQQGLASLLDLDGEAKSVLLPGTPTNLGKKRFRVGNPVPWLKAKGKFRKRILFISLQPNSLEAEHSVAFSGAPSFKLSDTLDQHVGINFEQDCRYTLLTKYNPQRENPSQEDINYCLPFLLAEIDAWKPDIIVCLGSAVFKQLTGIASETDEFLGNTLDTREREVALLKHPKIGLIWPPSTAIASPEMEKSWVFDLKCVLGRHNPPCATSWDEQDRLPVYRPKNPKDLAEAVDKMLVDTSFSIDTEYDPATDWTDATLFKIMVSSKTASLDLHLMVPKQGYKPIYIPATTGRFKGLPADYVPAEACSRLLFDSQAELDAYLGDMTVRPKPLHVFIRDYVWVWDGTPEEMAYELRRLLCRKGNRIWGHNARDDYKLLMRLGVNLIPYVCLDTITLAKCVDESQPLALEPIARRWLGAPSHKLLLADWLTTNAVDGGKLPYVFIPRRIIDPYGVSDARRGYDIVDPLLEELERQDAEGLSLGLPSIKDAYFKTKVPQFFALMEMEIVGQPINIQTMVTCMDWYEGHRKRLLKECIDEVLRLTKWETFNPDSIDDISKLLFEFLQLSPLHTTDKPPIPWDEVPPEEKASKRPAVDQETLEMLSAEHPLCAKLNICRILGTLEKNYLRRGAKWAHQTSEPASDASDFCLEFTQDIKPKAKKRTNVEKYLADTLSPTERWAEVFKDRKSRAISQVLNDKGYLHTSYLELLETDRLASNPNVSAITKGEQKELESLVGQKPPHAIRNIIEPRQKEWHKGLDILTFSCPPEQRDWVMIESDWTTGEVWYLVAISRDVNGNAIMGNPQRDIHASVAKNMFPYIPQDMSDLEIKEKFKAERDAAKPFVFGIPYGRGAGALVRRLNTEAVKRGEAPKYTQEDGETFIRSYQATLPQGWDYLQTQKARVLDPGFLVSPWGFRRRFPRNIRSKTLLASYQREALNWQIQHGIACVMMEATKAYLRLKKQEPSMPFFLCDILHDATKYLVHVSVLDYALKAIEYIMSDGLHLPFTPGASLRHSVELSYSWCGKKVDPAQLRKQQITWEDVVKVIPTAPYSKQLISSVCDF